MLHLASETPPTWVDVAKADVDELLLDHAHCEKKAASTAINLIFRYQHRPELMTPLSALAREELEHFERVIVALSSRGVTFGPLEPTAYAADLYAAVRRDEPRRLVDTLLVCALIEARSCERMKLVADALPDGLRTLYRDLLASEARHHTTYVDLALNVADHVDVRRRLAALAEHEAAVIASLPVGPRLHAGAGAARPAASPPTAS